MDNHGQGNQAHATLQDRWQQALVTRQREGNLRTLAPPLAHVSLTRDFFSNDYLSLAHSEELEYLAQGILADHKPVASHGATGARLLSGNSTLAHETEQLLATSLQAEACLLFNSGYVANLGMLQALVSRHDVVLYDQLIHASLREGLRLGLGRNISFRHQDLNHLESLLQRWQEPTAKAGGVVWVLVESLYSMDGDFCPLASLVPLCERYGAAIMLDEAHSTGIMGPGGGGMAVALGLQDRIAVRMHSFGKGPGVHGAVVAGSRELVHYLINFSRAFIYTTMLPAHSLATIMASFQLLQDATIMQQELLLRINHWQRLAVNEQQRGQLVSSNAGPIQWISTPGNVQAKAVAHQLQQLGFQVRPVLAPTVPVGEERLRICLHLHNPIAELEALWEAVRLMPLG